MTDMRQEEKMGCDIHSILQVKENNQWVSKEIGVTFRNYDAFAILAGIRNPYDLIPISPQRGLPEDFNIVDYDLHPDTIESPYHRPDGYYMGEYGYGWVLLSEIFEYRDKMKPEDLDKIQYLYNWAKTINIKYKNEYKEFRLVFGFDS